MADDAVLEFVARMRDEATSTANRLDRMLSDLGGPVDDITAAIRVDASGAQRAAAVAEDVADSIPPEFEKAGEEAGDRLGEGVERGLGDLPAKVGAVAAGAAIGSAIAGGVAAGLNIEASNDKLAAQLGATGEYAGDLGKIAGDLYAGAYGDSLDTVNVALRGVMQNGVVMEDATTEQVEGITAKVLDLATAFDQDLGGTTRAVGQMIRTGLAKDADEALDLLTRGFQQGGDKAEDLLDTVNEYGTQWRKLGLDGGTALGLISQGLKAGARDADIVADAVKEFSIRAIDGSELTAQGFEGIGLSAEDMAAKIAAGGPTAAAALDQTLDKLRAVEDPAKRSQLAVALFGTQAEDLGEALFKLDPSSAVGALGNVEGAAAAMGQTLNDNAATNIESWKRQAQAAFVDVLGGKVIPAVEDAAAALSTNFGPAVETVIGAVSSVVGWFKEHKAVAIALAAVIGTLTAVTSAHAAVLAVQAAGGLAAYIGQMRVVQAATRVWAAVQWVLNAAMSANPIGLVILAIAALIAGIILAWKHSETFREIVTAAWEAIKGAVGAVVDWLTTAIPAAWQWIKDTVGKVVGALVAVVTGYFALWRAVITTVLGAIRSVVSGAWSWITGRIKVAVALVTALISGGFGMLKGIASRAWDAVVNVISGVVGRVRSAVGRIVDTIKSVLSGVTGTMRRIGGDIVDGVVNGITGAVGRVASAARRIVSNITGPVKKLLGIASPSKVTRKLANYAGEGVVLGLADQAPAIASQAEKLARVAEKAARPNLPAYRLEPGGPGGYSGRSPGGFPPGYGGPGGPGPVGMTVRLEHRVRFEQPEVADRLSAEDVADLIARDPRAAATIEKAVRQAAREHDARTIGATR